MAYTFDLVPVNGDILLTDEAFNKVRFHLSESQPATRVSIVGDPRRIRVRAQGQWAAIASGVLTRIEELAGVRLEQVPVRDR